MSRWHMDGDGNEKKRKIQEMILLYPFTQILSAASSRSEICAFRWKPHVKKIKAKMKRICALYIPKS